MDNNERLASFKYALPNARLECNKHKFSDQNGENQHPNSHQTAWKSKMKLLEHSVLIVFKKHLKQIKKVKLSLNVQPPSAVFFREWWFRRIHRILISWDIIVRCPLGRQPVMHKPLGRVLFHLRGFLSKKECRDSRSSLLFLPLTQVTCDLSLIFQPKNPGDHAEFHTPIYQSQTSFPHALSLKRNRWHQIFISVLKQVNHYLSAV